MKTSMTHQEIKSAVCTVSTSILLCSALEIQASPPEDAAISWSRGDIPILFLLPLDPVRLAGNLAATGPGNAQIGPALYAAQNTRGDTQRAGLFVGPSPLPSNAAGFVATPAANAVNLQSQSLGAYWSLTAAQGWHVNLVAMGTRLNGQARSEQGDWRAAEGNAVTLSVEGGFPIGIGENWIIEPQAQLINQRASLGSQSTAAVSAPYDQQTSWSGRVGARLTGSYQVRGLPVEPYVRTNLWRTYSSGETLTLGQVDKVSSSRNSSTVELGLGLLAKVSPTVSLFVSADFSSDAENAFGLIGNLGVRMRW